jgi:osmotically-inducible protein OsmY
LRESSPRSVSLLHPIKVEQNMFASHNVTFAGRCSRWALCALILMGSANMLASTAPQLPHQTTTDQNSPNNKPVHDQKATKDVSEKLEKAFDPKNAAYAGSSIQPVVDDQTVTLDGTVKDEGQREMAMQLARAYAGNRKIVDRLRIQP